MLLWKDESSKQSCPTRSLIYTSISVSQATCHLLYFHTLTLAWLVREAPFEFPWHGEILSRGGYQLQVMVEHC